MPGGVVGWGQLESLLTSGDTWAVATAIKKGKKTASRSGQMRENFVDVRYEILVTTTFW